MKDHYATLGLGAEADPELVAAAWRLLREKHGPGGAAEDAS